MLKFLVLILPALCAAEDVTGSAYEWPDHPQGKNVLQILTSEKNAKPSASMYPKWYDSHSLRFVNKIPTHGEELAGGQLFVLEAENDDADPDLGMIATDKAGKELGRYIISFWGVGDIDRDSKDDLNPKNRAVVAIDLSNANEWEVSKDREQNHISNLNRQGFLNVLQACEDFADTYQFFNEYEITMPDGTVKQPAVTGDSLVEMILDGATHQKAFEEGVVKMSFLALNAKVDKLEPVSALQVKDLMASKTFASHYKKDLFLVPAYYDAKGMPLTKSETPEQWYVVQTAGVSKRDNKKAVSLFQKKASHHKRHTHGRKTLMRSLMQQKSKGHHRHHGRHHGRHHRRHAKKVEEVKK